MADFPTSKKTWADLVDSVSPANSSDINSAYAEITAIEDVFLTDSTSLNASTDIHGFLPKLDGSSDTFLNGTGGFATPRLDLLSSPADVTTLNATTDAHGLLLKLDGSSDNFLNGLGAWAIPPGGGGASSDLIVHGHTGAADGGAITLDGLQAPTDVTTLNASTDTHGLLPKLDGSTDNFLDGTGVFAKPRLDLLAAPADVTTLNASTDAHGLLPKLDGTVTNFLNGTGAWSAPVGSSTDLATHNHSDTDTGGLIRLDTITAPTDSTSLDSSTDMHGLLPKLDGTSDNYLNGKGEWWNVPTATTDTYGKNMIASSSDINAGTTDNLMLGTNVFTKSNYGIRFVYAPLNGSTALAAGDKSYFPIPAEMTGWNLVEARATCGANTSSDNTVFTVKKAGGGQTMLSTNITIEAAELDSLDATTQPAISSSDNPVTSTDIIEVAATSDCGAGMTYAGVLTGWQLP